MLSPNCRSVLYIAVLTALAAMPGTSHADPQRATGAGTSDAQRLDSVMVLGSRRHDRASDTDSLVPIDVLPMDTAATQGGKFDLTEMLQYASPSFTAGRQTGADNTDSVENAALRGLGSDQTLVLVNGKRLHSAALVNLFGVRNRGATGADLNTIPLLAIERVEILRDGAAAQYGSDAIAGVVNLSLKRDKGCQLVAGYGEYSRGDGENWVGSGYCGFGLGNDGVLAMTMEYQDRGRSNRATDADPHRIIGDSQVRNGTFYLNGEVPAGDNGAFYFNGGIQNRDASSAAWGRGGIGSDDIPSRNSEAMYPDGYAPFIDAYVQDRHGTAGMWWMSGDWRMDLSQTAGYNRLMDTIRNTMNASIANLDLENGGPGISPSVFDAGGFSFAQETTNFDVSRFFGGWRNGLNVAFGAEFRHETYHIYAGEQGSWDDYDGPGGGNAGSQGFPGFQPSDATKQSRHSWAGYLDVETYWTERFSTDQAIRFEDYSDFGSTATGKLAAAFRANDAWLLRGSASTGFRAPSLQQRYFSSTFTDFVNGVPVDVVLAPNGGAVAAAAGIPSLTEETSRNFTLGFTWTPTDALSITLDGYRIDIDDRIVLSGRFQDDDPSIGDILQSLNVGEAQFFVNSVDTRTRGIDLTINHRAQIGQGRLNTFLAFNRGTTKVLKVNTPPNLLGREESLLEERDRRFIEGASPRSKAVLGFDYDIGNWATDLKVIYFGPMTLGTFSGPPVPNQEYAGRTSADLSFTYSFSDNAKLTLGGTNLLDTFPSRQDPDETDNGYIYEGVQFGINGRAWFTRFSYSF